MSLTRRLAYIDTFVEKLNQVIANGCDGDPIWFPDNTTNIKFVVEMNLNEFTKILSALMTGADLSYPEQSHEVVWSFLRQVECPVSLCPDILDCLQAAFDELNAKLDNIQTGVTNITSITETIQQVLEENGAGLPTLPTAPTVSAAYAGAVAVVEWMNATNLEIYAEAEASAADNASEVISVILRLFPKWSGNGVEEGAALGNAYFENQVEQYNSDYPDFLLPAACQLYCLIAGNSGNFTYDVWSIWLDSLDTGIPDNAASAVYARYSPFRQTFLNQIAAFINQEQSLQEYFAELYNVYYTGTTNPIPVPETCECGWCVIFTGTDLHSLFFPAGGLGAQAVWTGTGYARNDAVAPSRITIAVDLGSSVNIQTIRVVNSVAITGGTDNIKNILSYPAYATMQSQPGTADTLFDFGAGTVASTFAIDCITDIVGFTPVPGEIIEVQITGNGFAPDIAQPCP